MSANTKKNPSRYRPQYCEALIQFFDVKPFSTTEVIKKDGSVSVVETASLLPTFAAFAHTLGVTCATLLEWEKVHPAFAQAAQRARDLQGNILIQNGLRGNYSSSFVVFTAKNLLGWKEGKEDIPAGGPLVVRWENQHEETK